MQRASVHSETQLAHAPAGLFTHSFRSALMSSPKPKRTTSSFRLPAAVLQWIDSDYTPSGPEQMRNEPDRVDWMRCLPFLILHLGCLAAFWVGVSPIAVWTAFALYVVRMFAVTGIYHRYFSHKTYSTSRVGQFLLALWGGTTVQRGALWWAYHHRHHHQKPWTCGEWASSGSSECW